MIITENQYKVKLIDNVIILKYYGLKILTITKMYDIL